MHLADCWNRTPEAWLPVCNAYLKHQREDYLRGVKTETEFFDWLHSSAINRRIGFVGTQQDYPDGLVWLRQCAQFLLTLHGPAVTAAVFECIEIVDLARLLFDGDLLKARAIHEQALEDIRTWHHKGSKISVN